MCLKFTFIQAYTRIETYANAPINPISNQLLNFKYFQLLKQLIKSNLMRCMCLFLFHNSNDTAPFKLKVLLMFQSSPAILGADNGKIVWESGFCPFFPGCRNSSSYIALCFVFASTLLTYYECQNLSRVPIFSA